MIFSIHTEVCTINCQDLRSNVQLSHDHDRGIRQVHLPITRHQRSNARPMSREIEGKPHCFALEQLKQRIDRQAILPQEPDDFCEYLGDERTCIADRDH